MVCVISVTKQSSCASSNDGEHFKKATDSRRRFVMVSLCTFETLCLRFVLTVVIAEELFWAAPVHLLSRTFSGFSHYFSIQQFLSWMKAGEGTVWITDL